MQIAIGRLWIVIALVASCLAAPALARTSEAEFTRQMAERFRAAMPGVTIEISEPLQLLVGLAPDTGEVNLGAIFISCQNNTVEECDADVASFVQQITEGMQELDAPIAREQLRVAVRSSDYCDHIGPMPTPGSENLGPIMRPYVSGLCALIMADYPRRMRGVTVEDLGRLGLETDAAWALAQRQTLANLPRPEALEGLRDSIVSVIDYEYIPSLMLNTEGWRTASAAAGGDLILAVPDNFMMIVARRSNVRDLEGFKALTRENFETADRGISPLVYRWTETGWVPLD